MSNETELATAEYTPCYLAFLDIMGFKKLVEDRCKVASLVGLINSLAAHETREPDPQRGMFFHRRDSDTDQVKTWMLQVRPFSDSIVLFMPAETRGLSWLLGKVRYLHDSVVSMGYVMRGAVVIDDMYWDDSWSSASGSAGSQDASASAGRSTNQASFITVGPAMVEAYELENEKAVFPRIILRDDLVEHIKSNKTLPDHSRNKTVDGRATAFPLTSGNDLALMDFMKQDDDGWYFFHVLSKHMYRQGEGKPVINTTKPDGENFIICQHDRVEHVEWMRNVGTFIAQKLAEHKADACYAKYRWFARYYNRSLGDLALPKLDFEDETS